MIVRNFRRMASGSQSSVRSLLGGLGSGRVLPDNLDLESMNGRFEAFQYSHRCCSCDGSARICIAAHNKHQIKCEGHAMEGPGRKNDI